MRRSAPRTAKRGPASPRHPSATTVVTRPRADRTAPRVTEGRRVPAGLPAAAHRATDERPVIDGLGSALRLVPLFALLGVAGALWSVSRLRRAA